MNKKYLLPTGFYDLLGDEAKVNQKAIDILQQKFENFGYDLIKTPLVEFEETYDAPSGSFKMVDIFSGNNLVVRNDITTQISRLFATKLKEENLPLRLSYCGDVLKVKNDDLHEDRQLTQAGIELIGNDSVDANKEVTGVILQGLSEIGLSDLLIDFSIPQFLNSLLKDLKLDSEDLKLAIRQKNVSAIKNYGGKYADDLIGLVLQVGDFTAIADKLSNLPISKQIQNKLANLEEVINNLQDDYSSISISVNVFGDEDFLYHEDIAFTIFEEGFDYPIVRGGRYKIDNQTPAVGATIYINNLRKILVKMPIEGRKRILLSSQTSSMDVKRLQKDGYVTLMSLTNKNPNKQNLLEDSKRSNCDFIYWDKEIVKS